MRILFLDVIMHIRLDSNVGIVFGCNNVHPNGFRCGYSFYAVSDRIFESTLDSDMILL